MRTPVVTRWNSDYDSIACAMSKDPYLLDSLMTRLKLDPLDVRDRQSLTADYLAVCHPIARILDQLQKDDSNYLGCALPAIINMKTMMHDVKGLAPDGLGNCIREGLSKHIDRR